MNDSNPEYLRTPEAAKLIGFSTEYLEIARHRGEGPPVIRIGRACRYSKASLFEWMQRHERKHPSAPTRLVETTSELLPERNKR